MSMRTPPHLRMKPTTVHSSSNKGGIPLKSQASSQNVVHSPSGPRRIEMQPTKRSSEPLNNAQTLQESSANNFRKRHKSPTNNSQTLSKSSTSNNNNNKSPTLQKSPSNLSPTLQNSSIDNARKFHEQIVFELSQTKEHLKETVDEIVYCEQQMSEQRTQISKLQNTMTSSFTLSDELLQTLSKQLKTAQAELSVCSESRNNCTKSAIEDTFSPILQTIISHSIKFKSTAEQAQKQLQDTGISVNFPVFDINIPSIQSNKVQNNGETNTSKHLALSELSTEQLIQKIEKDQQNHKAAITKLKRTHEASLGTLAVELKTAWIEERKRADEAEREQQALQEEIEVLEAALDRLMHMAPIDLESTVLEAKGRAQDVADHTRAAIRNKQISARSEHERQIDQRVKKLVERDLATPQSNISFQTPIQYERMRLTASTIQPDSVRTFSWQQKYGEPNNVSSGFSRANVIHTPSFELSPAPQPRRLNESTISPSSNQVDVATDIEKEVSSVNEASIHEVKRVADEDKRHNKEQISSVTQAHISSPYVNETSEEEDQAAISSQEADQNQSINSKSLKTSKSLRSSKVHSVTGSVHKNHVTSPMNQSGSVRSTNNQSEPSPNQSLDNNYSDLPDEKSTLDAFTVSQTSHTEEESSGNMRSLKHDRPNKKSNVWHTNAPDGSASYLMKSMLAFSSASTNSRTDYSPDTQHEIAQQYEIAQQHELAQQHEITQIRELAQIRGAVPTLQNRILTISTEVHELRHALQEARHQVQNSKETADTLRHEKAQLKHQIQRLEERLNRVGVDTDSSDIILQDMRRQLHTLRTDNERLTVHLNAIELREKTLVNELKTSREHYYELETTLTHRENDIAYFRTQIAQREDELSHERTKLARIQRELENARTDISDSHREEAIAHESVRELKSKIIEMETNAQREQSELRTQIAHLSVELEQVKTECEQYQQDSQAAADDLRAVLDKAEATVEEKEHLEHRLKRSLDELAVFREELEISGQHSRETSTMLKKLREQKQEVEIEVETFQTKVQSLRDTIADNENKFVQFDRTIVSLQRTKELTEMKLRKTEASLQSAQGEIQRLLQVETKQTECISVLRQDIIVQKESIMKLEIDKKDLQQQINELQSQRSNRSSNVHLHVRNTPNSTLHDNVNTQEFPTNTRIRLLQQERDQAYLFVQQLRQELLTLQQHFFSAHQSPNNSPNSTMSNSALVHPFHQTLDQTMYRTPGGRTFDTNAADIDEQTNRRMNESNSLGSINEQTKAQFLNEQTTPQVINEQTKAQVLNEQTKAHVLNEHVQPRIIDEHSEPKIINEQKKGQKCSSTDTNIPIPNCSEINSENNQNTSSSSNTQENAGDNRSETTLQKTHSNITETTDRTHQTKPGLGIVSSMVMTSTNDLTHQTKPGLDTVSSMSSSSSTEDVTHQTKPGLDTISSMSSLSSTKDSTHQTKPGSDRVSSMSSSIVTTSEQLTSINALEKQTSRPASHPQIQSVSPPESYKDTLTLNDTRSEKKHSTFVVETMEDSSWNTQQQSTSGTSNESQANQTSQTTKQTIQANPDSLLQDTHTESGQLSKYEAPSMDDDNQSGTFTGFVSAIPGHESSIRSPNQFHLTPYLNRQIDSSSTQNSGHFIESNSFGQDKRFHVSLLQRSNSIESMYDSTRLYERDFDSMFGSAFNVALSTKELRGDVHDVQRAVDTLEARLRQAQQESFELQRSLGQASRGSWSRSGESSSRHSMSPEMNS